jgi:peptidoglycan-associated lipoprotein
MKKLKSLTSTPIALAAVAAALVLGGCASDVKLDTPPVENRSTTNGAAGNAGSGAPASQVANVDLAAQNAAAWSKLGKVVYFDFDSFVVKDEFRPLVDSYAKLMNADRKKKVVVEGHTDERGGREYNLALGQKRAEAVVRSLSLLGVQEGQLEAVSYGKERPSDTGHDESAWAKNRRAELRER